jgi:hypothetical protein
MSIEFVCRKISSSAFLFETAFAFHAKSRRLRFTVKGRDSLSQCPQSSPIWRLDHVLLEVDLLMLSLDYIISVCQTC